MSTTPGASDLEARLRAALAARADLVRGEDLTPLATVTPLRPRWSTPWVLLAAAAVVLLVLGVVLQGVGGRTRSDEVAPEPDAPQLELPADVGRGWEPATLSRAPRLDLDGDGTREKVDFLAEPTKDFDGRFRMQTTLSTTGEEAYGIAKVGTTIGTNVLDPIDADGDGDQELVLYFDDPDAGPGGGGHPLVFDLRDGLLVQARRGGSRAARARRGSGDVRRRASTTTWFASMTTGSRTARCSPAGRGASSRRAT